MTKRGDYTIKLLGLNRLMKKTAGNAEQRSALKTLLVDIGQVALAAARQKAPHGRTDQLAEKLQYKVNPGPDPRWVVIKTDAMATPKRPGARGTTRTKYPYSYPKLIEFSPKHGHREWLRTAVRGARTKIYPLLKKAGLAIEDRWRAP